MSIIGVEGVCNAGKTTAIATVVDQIRQRGYGISSFCCYADELQGAGITLPQREETVEGRMKNLDLLLQVEKNRSRELKKLDLSKELVITDRTWLTLAAHSFVVEKLYRMKVFKKTLTILERREDIIRPSKVFFLNIPESALQNKISPGKDISFIGGRLYNNFFVEFFSSHAPKLAKVEEVNGDLPKEELALLLVEKILELKP